MSGFDRHTATIVSQYYARHGEAESKGALALFDAQTLAPRSIIPSDDEVFGRTLSVNIIGHLLLQADDKGETDDEEPVKIFVADHAAEQFGCATPAAAAPAGKRQPALPPTFHLLAEVILPKARYIQERAFHVDQDADGTLSLMVATGVGSVTYVDGMNVMEPVTMEIQCIARSRPGPDGKRVAVPPTECPAQSIAVGTVVGEKYDYGKVGCAAARAALTPPVSGDGRQFYLPTRLHGPSLLPRDGAARHGADGALPHVPLGRVRLARVVAGVEARRRVDGGEVRRDRYRPQNDGRYSAHLPTPGR